MFRKQKKKQWKNIKFNSLILGLYGVRVLDSCRMTPKQFETIRRVFVKLTNRNGKFLIRMAVNHCLTKKSKGSRMGKGLGSVDFWVMDIKAGQIIFEFSFFDQTTINTFISEIKNKVPANIEVVYRDIIL